MTIGNSLTVDVAVQSTYLVGFSSNKRVVAPDFAEEQERAEDSGLAAM